MLKDGVSQVLLLPIRPTVKEELEKCCIRAVLEFLDVACFYRTSCRVLGLFLPERVCTGAGLISRKER